MNIITKFTVVTEQGMDALLLLTNAIAKEKFTGQLAADTLDTYISNHFTEQVLIVEVNSMSNQWLVTYADNEPAGYARITSKGERPEIEGLDRIIRIADFGVLSKFSGAGIKEALIEKCLSVCKAYQAVWINEYAGNPLIPFFENHDFIKQNELHQSDELPLASVLLIRKQP